MGSTGVVDTLSLMHDRLSSVENTLGGIFDNRDMEKLKNQVNSQINAQNTELEKLYEKISLLTEHVKSCIGMIETSDRELQVQKKEFQTQKRELQQEIIKQKEMNNSLSSQLHANASHIAYLMQFAHPQPAFHAVHPHPHRNIVRF